MIWFFISGHEKSQMIIEMCFAEYGKKNPWKKTRHTLDPLLNVKPEPKPKVSVANLNQTITKKKKREKL